MTSREADPTSVLLFFFLPLSSFSPLCIHPIYSLRLLVNELLVRRRKNWFIRDRCVLTHKHTYEWGYCSVPINPFTSRFSLVCPRVPSLCLSPCPNSTSLSFFLFLLFLQGENISNASKSIFLPLFFSTVDHSRVKLGLKTTNQDTDYVNANFIKVKVPEIPFSL